MTYGYSDNKVAVLKRLKRAEGQVRGVAKMVEEDKYCIDILTQINAAQAALDKVAVKLLRDHAKHCMAHVTDDVEQKAKADELVDAIGRMLSR
jgi:DNA-binding FrmR family transcriptional regulator